MSKKKSKETIEDIEQTQTSTGKKCHKKGKPGRKMHPETNPFNYWLFVTVAAVGVVFSMVSLRVRNNPNQGSGWILAAIGMLLVYSAAAIFIVWLIRCFIDVVKTVKADKKIEPLDDPSLNKLDEDINNDPEKYIEQVISINDKYRNYVKSNLTVKEGTREAKIETLGALIARRDKLRSKMIAHENMVSLYLSVFVSVVTSIVVTLCSALIKRMIDSAVTSDTIIGTLKSLGTSGVYSIIVIAAVGFVGISIFVAVMVRAFNKKRGEGGSLNYLVRDYEMEVLTSKIQGLQKELVENKGE